MALFDFRRFNGGLDDGKESQEADILQNLESKIKKKSIEKNPAERQNVEEAEQETSFKKKQKKKNQNENAEEESAEHSDNINSVKRQKVEEVEQETTFKKKQKKKKKNQNENAAAFQVKGHVEEESDSVKPAKRQKLEEAEEMEQETTFKEKLKKKKNKNKSENAAALQVKNQNTNENEKENAAFQVIGHDNMKQAKVDMVLPVWLANPIIIDGNDFGKTPDYLTPAMQQALKDKLNCKLLFPVQNAVIPWLLSAHAQPHPFKPRDICVSAPTGSGKTLAYAVPIIQLLNKRVSRKIRALVVLPVAELALQVFKVFNKLCSNTNLKVQLLSKQTPFPKEQAQLVGINISRQHYSKADIVITTPGRLIEHLHCTKGFSLHALKFLVIDEADRFLDAAFQNWLQHYKEHMSEIGVINTKILNYKTLLTGPEQPHKLLFSATLTQDPEKLERLQLFKPLLFTAQAMDGQLLKANTATEQKTVVANVANNAQTLSSRYTLPKELTEKYCLTEDKMKPLSLYALIQEHHWRKFICFTNSAEAAERY